MYSACEARLNDIIRLHDQSRSAAEEARTAAVAATECVLKERIAALEV